jgi:hypothetical protein
MLRDGLFAQAGREQPTSEFEVAQLDLASAKPEQDVIPPALQI